MKKLPVLFCLFALIGWWTPLVWVLCFATVGAGVAYRHA